MNIRKVETKDLDKCIELLHLPEFMFPNGQFPDLDYLKIYFDSGLFFVAEKDSKVLGCIFGEKMLGGIAMLWYFAVDPDFRGLGIGKEMIYYFEKECKKQNIEWIVLYSPTKSPKSLKFYEKMGYNKGNSYVEFNKELK
jgi:ribosomal protein S18 acetylase RimI-like enzyme